ncbi:MAG: 5-formyltetrahydrofolate cyclo-ligase [Egibacteraceae bacterium]
MSDERSIRADKASLRERVLAGRAALGDAHRASASETIRARVAALERVGTARRIAAYATFGDEVDLDGLIEGLLEAGVEVCLPFVDDDGVGLARVEDFEGLVEGYRGVREPPPEARERVDPTSLDVALVPGVAFDRRGRRLGYGGGHLDRLLALLGDEVSVVGIAYADQIVDAVPREAHDVTVDTIITEDDTLSVQH